MKDLWWTHTQMTFAGVLAKFFGPVTFKIFPASVTKNVLKGQWFARVCKSLQRSTRALTEVAKNDFQKCWQTCATAQWEQFDGNDGHIFVYGTPNIYTTFNYVRTNHWGVILYLRYLQVGRIIKIIFFPITHKIHAIQRSDVWSTSTQIWNGSKIYIKPYLN
jgi:hypothetical protein